jgi:hypothetical protein
MKAYSQKGTTHEWIWTESDDGSLSIQAGCFTGTLSDLIERIGTDRVVQRFDLIKEALRALSRRERVRLVADGSGYGSGGNGYGDGNGNGYGDGNGDGNGYGNGHGNGHGNGSGYGSGSGNGWGGGCGNGDGIGDGYGHGNGDKYKGFTYSIII